MPGPFTKILKTGGGACCPCDQQEGCGCQDTACVTQCQYKADAASLCGFDEFTAPSSPPKKYLKKLAFTPTPAPGSPPDNEGIGPCGRYQDAHCTDVPTCVRDSDMTFGPVNVPGFGIVHSVGKFTFQGIVTGGLARYLAHDLATEVNGNPTETAIFVSGPNVRLHDGETIDLNHDTNYSIALQYNFVSWNNATGDCVNDANTYGGEADVWDYSQDYNPAGCSLTQSIGTSKRYVVPHCLKAIDNPFSALQPDFTVGPQALYGDQVTLQSEDSVERVWGPVGCVEDIDGKSTNYAGGPVTELLSHEDTEADAIARSKATIPDWTGADCSFATTFITLRGAGEFTFGYRAVRTRATAGDLTNPLTVGHTYRVTFHYKWRVLGTGGPFTDFGTDEITFSATHTIETTDWLDVPMEDAKEIRVSFCVVEDVTPP